MRYDIDEDGDDLDDDACSYRRRGGGCVAGLREHQHLQQLHQHRQEGQQRCQAAGQVNISCICPLECCISIYVYLCICTSKRARNAAKLLTMSEMYVAFPLVQLLTNYITCRKACPV